jgi:hypothetical protein
MDPVRALIDKMLREDLDAPRKQRHTARRVWTRLIDEYHVEVSYSTVRAYVARRRPEILIEAGRALEEWFVPQNHPPGAEAEVDFADLWIDLRGARTRGRTRPAARRVRRVAAQCTRRSPWPARPRTPRPDRRPDHPPCGHSWNTATIWSGPGPRR